MSEFTGLFPAADQAAATTVYNDLVKIVTDSGVTSTDLTTVASQQTAVQTDLSNLRGGGSGSSTTLTAGTSTTMTASASSGAGGSGTGGSAGKTGGGRKAHHRKPPPPPRRHRRL